MYHIKMSIFKNNNTTSTVILNRFIVVATSKLDMQFDNDKCFVWLRKLDTIKNGNSGLGITDLFNWFT